MNTFFTHLSGAYVEQPEANSEGKCDKRKASADKEY
jgi:hypothetical protein